jgi:lipopolysaccharide export system permease protein
MSILTRYICRRLIIYYLGFLALIVLFFVFINFMENIDMVTKHDAPLRLIVLYYIYYLPRIFIEVSWIGFLVAMLLVFGGLARNNEFTAMLAGGVSMYRLAAPILGIGAILSAAVFCVQEFAVPPAMLRVHDLEESKFAESNEGQQVSDIAGIGRRNQRYFFEKLDVDKGVVSGVHIYTVKGGSITGRIDAEKGVWDESSERWYLENGDTREFDATGAVVGRAEFSRMKAPFRESPAMLKRYASTGGKFNFLQLRQQIKNLRRSGYDARPLKLDYQKKFAIPLVNLIVVLLGIPFALECRRGGLVLGFALSLAAALSYYGFFQINLALGKSEIFPATVAAWLANILFLGVGVGLTLRART